MFKNSREKGHWTQSVQWIWMNECTQCLFLLSVQVNSLCRPTQLLCNPTFFSLPQTHTHIHILTHTHTHNPLPQTSHHKGFFSTRVGVGSTTTFKHSLYVCNVCVCLYFVYFPTSHVRLPCFILLTSSLLHITLLWRVCDSGWRQEQIEQQEVKEWDHDDWDWWLKLFVTWHSDTTCLSEWEWIYF